MSYHIAKPLFPFPGGVTLPVDDAPPLSDKTLPPLKFFVTLKKKEKKRKSGTFFLRPPVGEYTNKALFLVRGPKIQENSAPLIRHPPPHTAGSAGP